MAFRSCRKPVIDFSGMVTSASSPVKNGAILCTRGRNFSFCFLAHWRFASKLIHPQTGGKTPKSKWRPFSCIFPKHNFWEKSFRFHPLWSRRTLDRTQKRELVYDRVGKPKKFGKRPCFAPVLTKQQEFFPLFWVDNNDDFGVLYVVKSVLSCLEGNTSKLSQRLRISCIDALLVSDPSMLSSFVLSSGKRLVFALASSPFSYLFCCCFFSNKIRKGKKKIIFHFTVCLPFVTLTTSWGKSLSSLIKTTLFLRLISKTYVDIFRRHLRDISPPFSLIFWQF